MRHYTFKVFEDIDPDIIKKLNGLSCRQRSEEIRKALRTYFRGQTGAAKVIYPSASDLPLLNEVSDDILEVKSNPEPERNPEEVAKENLDKLADMF